MKEIYWQENKNALCIEVLLECLKTDTRSYIMIKYWHEANWPKTLKKKKITFKITEWRKKPRDNKLHINEKDKC